MVNLGAGVASNPVLDSSGTHVIIQMSTGDIKNFNVELPMKVLRPWAGGKGRGLTQTLTPTLSQREREPEGGCLIADSLSLWERARVRVLHLRDSERHTGFR